jgi:hypothetical protein
MQTYNNSESVYCNLIKHKNLLFNCICNQKNILRKYRKQLFIFSKKIHAINHALLHYVYVLINNLEQGGHNQMQKSNSPVSYDISSYETKKMAPVNPAQKLVNPAHLVVLNAESFGFAAICNSLTSLLNVAINSVVRNLRTLDATLTVELETVSFAAINLALVNLVTINTSLVNRVANNFATINMSLVNYETINFATINMLLVNYETINFAAINLALINYVANDFATVDFKAINLVTLTILTIVFIKKINTDANKLDNMLKETNNLSLYQKNNLLKSAEAICNQTIKLCAINFS